MKTLNKITRNLVLHLAVAGGLVLNGCGNKNLEKYNQEHKKDYENFVEFIEKNGEKSYDENDRENGISYNYTKEGKIVRIIVNRRLDAIYIYPLSGVEGMTIDYRMDGLNSGLFKSDKFLGNKIGLDPLTDIVCAQFYTNAIKEVMRNKKYKNY